MEAKDLSKDAVKLKLDISNFYESLRNCRDEKVIEEIGSIIAAPLCNLTKLVVPNVQKIDEVIYAAENGLQVQKNTQGADFQDEKGKNLEIKVSKYTQIANKCNFNWTIPAGDSESKRRKALLKSITKKTLGRGCVLRVQNYLNENIAEYSLCHEFLLEYFARIKIHSGIHNMGCERCKICLKFHRLTKLQKASETYQIDPVLVDWKHILGKTASQCS